VSVEVVVALITSASAVVVALISAHAQRTTHRVVGKPNGNGDSLFAALERIENRVALVEHVLSEFVRENEALHLQGLRRDRRGK
jgi:hypothetical protein